LLGKSSFHISCSDVDMNSSDDCGKQEGNNKTGTTFINDWQFKGMAGPNAVLACDATNTGPASDSCVIDASGGDVIYKYKVTNNSAFKVTGVTLTDDKLGNIDGTFDLDGGASATFQSDTVHIAQTTTNTATASANGGQCIATDIATVTTGCVIAYPYNSANPLTSVVFNESEVLRKFAPNVAFAGETIKVWYNDEHALTLGVGKVIVKTKTTTTTTYTVSPLPSNPGSAINPQVGTTLLTGDQAGTDLAGRPMFPALFITDITDDPNKCTPPGTAACRDWQWGGTGIPPHAVFGTWKGAVKNVDKTKTPTAITITPDADPAKNNWNLGAGSDTPPGGFASLTNEGYGAEVRWNVNDLGLLPGHVYRMQFMVHDGDQNKSGGDVGENCLTVSIPPGD